MARPKKTKQTDPATEVIQDKPIVHIVEGTTGVQIMPGHESKTVAVHVTDPARPRYEYTFLPAVGPVNQTWETKFRELGADGWDFQGVDSYGRSVFSRPL